MKKKWVATTLSVIGISVLLNAALCMICFASDDFHVVSLNKKCFAFGWPITIFYPYDLHGNLVPHSTLFWKFIAIAMFGLLLGQIFYLSLRLYAIIRKH